MEIRENDRNDNTFDLHLDPEEARVVHRLGYVPGAMEYDRARYIFDGAEWVLLTSDTPDYTPLAAEARRWASVQKDHEARTAFNELAGAVEALSAENERMRRALGIQAKEGFQSTSGHRDP